MINTIRLKFNKKKQLLKLKDHIKKMRYMYKYIVNPFILFYQYNRLSYPRIGYMISKKKIRYAHERNLIKRMIREHFRINQFNYPSIDIIIGITKLMDLNQLNKKILISKMTAICKFIIKTNNHPLYCKKI